MSQLKQLNLDEKERGPLARVLGFHPVIRQIQLVLGIRERLMLTLRLMQDSEVPFKLKLLPVGAIIYILSPIDLVPALLTGILGVVEDLFVASLLLNAFLNLVPEERLRHHAVALGYVEEERIQQMQAQPQAK